jgi:flagellar basal-body rod protein FlgG
MRIEESLAADLKVLETVSRNIANARTDGYRRVRAAPIFETHMQDNAVQPALVASMVDQKAGTLRYTGRSLDFAVDGNAYFEVEGPNGPLFTRRGAFAVDQNRTLVTAQGYPVMGLEGPIVLGEGEVSVTPAGELFSGATSLGRLSLAVPVDGTLKESGDGFYRMTREEATNVVVRQGFTEASNVDLLDEMMSLVMASRHFAMGQRVFATRDALVGESIKKIGEF